MPLYRQIDNTIPVGTGNIRDGDNRILEVRQALWDQWPNFTANPCNPSVSEINALVGLDFSRFSTIQGQLDYLDARVSLSPLPSSARNFLDASFWATSGAADQQRLYSDYAQFQDYSNVPWPWGSNMGGKDTDYMTLLIQRYVNNTQNVAVHRVLRVNLGPSGDGSDNYVQEFFRGARNSSQILSAPWQRSTTSQVSTAQSTSGNVITTTAKAEIETVCGGPIC